MEWAKNGSVYWLTTPYTTIDYLPNSIFSVRWNGSEGRFELVYVFDKFQFNYKIYDIDRSFIDYVKKTYDATKDNMGILLCGVKGTGKTVTSKIISNELNIPVVMIVNYDSGFTSFINNIKQDIIILIDEYDKLFSMNSGEINLLSLMDGVITNGYRRLFVLTSNTGNVNKNMIQRPGRIRYIKHYEDLTLDTINMILDDLLSYPEHKQGIISVLRKLEIITVDIVKSIINEVNIHNQDPSTFLDIFNICSIDSILFTISEIKEGKKRIVSRSSSIIIDGMKIMDLEFTDDDVEKNIEYTGCYLGVITEVHDSNTVTVENNHTGNIRKYQFTKIERTHRAFSESENIKNTEHTESE